VAAVQKWLTAAAIREGRVFRSVSRHDTVGAALSDQSVALVVKRRATLIGLDPARFTGHSLRARLAAAAAAANGVEERIIMWQTRHAGVTVRRYIRDGEVFVGNATGRIGL
jgi:integrase